MAFEGLMVSVSGVRGRVGYGLTPEVVATFAAAFGAWAARQGGRTIVVGRDSRVSGPMFTRIVHGALESVGCTVIDIGMAPTPTIQLAVEHHHAAGGLGITASHNPIEWNALKFIGPSGLFLSADEGADMRALMDRGIPRATWDALGDIVHDTDAVQRHIDQVLALPYLDVAGIRARRFRVALDCCRGAGGVIMPPAGYFDGLQKLLKKHDILLVCDEVVTGFARTGNMFGATTMNLLPDMLVYAKALSSAYIPISALLVNERIFTAIARQSDELGSFGLTMTYCGHPVASAVAREAIRIYEEEDFPARVRRLEAPFLGGLRGLATHPLVGEVRGLGLLAGVELVRDKNTHEPFAKNQKIGAICAALCEKHGLMLRAIGDTLALCPPLVISETEIEALLARLRLALDETAATLSAG